MQKKSRHAEIENSRRSRLSPTLSASNECVPRSAVSSQQLVWSMIRPGRCPEVQAREKMGPVLLDIPQVLVSPCFNLCRHRGIACHWHSYLHPLVQRTLKKVC